MYICYSIKQQLHLPLMRITFIIRRQRFAKDLLERRNIFSERSYVIFAQNDIFILASDLNNSEALPVAPTNTFNDLARTGNGIDNFGILRTFYVGGIERSYKINHNFKSFNNTSYFHYAIKTNNNINS